jgi:DNA-binding winged helix-turn-helix (wHTH) protein
MKQQTEHIYAFGPFLLDTSERVLSLEGKSISLAAKDFEALLILVENAGHLVNKDVLMSRLWPGTFVEEANVAKHISLLRRVLSEADKRPRIHRDHTKTGLSTCGAGEGSVGYECGAADPS